MKKSYLLVALVCCVGCNELEEADDRTPRGDGGTMDAASTPLDAHIHDSSDAGADAAHEGSHHEDASSPDAALVLPKTDFEAAEAVARRGRECGVVGEGAVGPDPTPGAFCAALCFVQADCEAFRKAVCPLEEEGDQTVDGPLGACLEACQEAADLDASVQCGDGTAVSFELLCDETADCASGEDEAHCSFTCVNGEVIDWFARCDGVEDCMDESDELGCASICGEPIGGEDPLHGGHGP